MATHIDNIADFNASDGIPPHVVQKLNNNFWQLTKGILSQEERIDTDERITTADDKAQAALDIEYSIVDDGSTVTFYKDDDPVDVIVTYATSSQVEDLIDDDVANDSDNVVTFTRIKRIWNALKSWANNITDAINDAIDSLNNSKADKATTLAGYGIADAYTKTEVDSEIQSAVTGLYDYKGSVQTYANLPSGAEVGDVYNVVQEYQNTPAGTNYAWNGTAWDPLGGEVDLSGYSTKDQTITSISRSGTTFTATRADGTTFTF